MLFPAQQKAGGLVTSKSVVGGNIIRYVEVKIYCLAGTKTIGE